MDSQSDEDLVGEDAKLGAVAARVSPRTSHDTTHTIRSEVSLGGKIPTAPFYGSRVVEITDLNKVFGFINETALFKGLHFFLFQPGVDILPHLVFRNAVALLD